MHFQTMFRLFLPALLLCLLAAPPARSEDAATIWEKEDAAIGEAYGRGDYATAEIHAKKALQQAEILGQNDRRYAMSIGDMGVIYLMQGRPDEAEPYLQRALALREELMGQVAETATAAHFLGEIQYSRGAYAIAVPLFEKALKIYEKVTGAESENTLFTLDYLAAAQANAGNCAQALPLFKRLLKVRTGQLGNSHADVEKLHEWLAVCYEETGKPAKAIDHLERAAAIKTELSGPDDPGLAWEYNKLAGLYQNQGKTAKAEQALVRELDLLEKQHGKTSSELLDVLYRMAEFYSANDRKKDADAAQRRYDEIANANKTAARDPLGGLTNMMEVMAAAGQQNRDVEAAWNKATADGQAASNKKDYETARRYYAEALELSGQLILADPKTAVSHNNLGTVYWALGRHSEADTSFLQAVNLGTKAGDLMPQADMKIILENYASFLNAQGRAKEAKPLEERAAAIK